MATRTEPVTPAGRQWWDEAPGRALLPPPGEEPLNPAGQTAPTILLIEDDPAQRDLLVLGLSNSGYRLLEAEDGWQGLDLLRTHPVDLVLLDLMLPGLNGWDAIRRLREVSLVPILVLTACGHERDEVLGLSLGADDYVTKPFSFSRLRARIDALTRRSEAGRNARKITAYQDEVLHIDLWRRRVSIQGRPVPLTPTEYRILVCLVRHRGQVVSHEQLLLEVWGDNYEGAASLKAYIGYLRRKIEPDPRQPQLIHTCWGVGYRYEPTPGVENGGPGEGAHADPP